MLCQDVRDMFQRFYNTVLGPLVGRLVDEQLAPQVQRACSHVADRLIYTFLRTGDNRLRGIMMHALQPSHGWQQGSAPLHTWLSRELAGLHFQGVVDVIQNEYKPKVLEESAGIVTNAIFNLFSYLDQANRIDGKWGLEVARAAGAGSVIELVMLCDCTSSSFVVRVQRSQVPSCGASSTQACCSSA